MLDQVVFDELPITRGFSEQALNELASVLEGASARSQARFVRALCYGVTSHKDALGYDLVQAKAFITRVEREIGQSIDQSGFPLLTLEPSEIAIALRQTTGVTLSQGLLQFEDVRLHTRHLPLYAQLENFLLSMDDFSFTKEWTALSKQLQSRPDDEVTIKEIAQALSRRLYRYRKEHFGLYEAYRQYTEIAAFADTEKVSPAELVDDQVLSFWLSQPHEFVSFNALLRAVKSFRQYQERGTFVELDSLNLETEGVEPNKRVELEELEAQLANLRSSMLPLVPKANIDAFADWLEHYDVRSDLAQSIARALSFAPVSNLLAQLKRQAASDTKKAERLEAQSAVSYANLLADLDGQCAKLQEACLEVASILKRPELDAGIIDFRAAKRRKSRSKGYKRSEEEVRQDAEIVTDAVATMNLCARAIQEAQKAQGFPEDKMEAIFQSDQDRFLAVFRRVHLT